MSFYQLDIQMNTIRIMSSDYCATPPPPPPHPPQLSIKSKQVYKSPTSTYDTFLESLGQDLSNPAYRVNTRGHSCCPVITAHDSNSIHLNI